MDTVWLRQFWHSKNAERWVVVYEIEYPDTEKHSRVMYYLLTCKAPRFYESNDSGSSLQSKWLEIFSHSHKIANLASKVFTAAKRKLLPVALDLMITGSTEESYAVKSFEAKIGNFVLIVKNSTESATYEPAFVKFNDINRNMFSFIQYF